MRSPTVAALLALGKRRLLLAQHQVHDPASANVRHRSIATVVQYITAVAPGVLEGVSQNRHPVEGAMFVDAAGQHQHVGSEPRGIRRDRAKRIAKDVAKKGDLSDVFCCAFEPERFSSILT